MSTPTHPAKRARHESHDADHKDHKGGAVALCGPDRTPVSIPHAAAVRMRMVADILEDSSEDATSAGQLEIPLPQVEAPVMRAAVDFLLVGKAAGLCAPLLRDDCGAADVVPLLLAASFLQAPELEAVALASLAMKARAAGAAVLAAHAVPTIELFAGLGVGHGGANTRVGDTGASAGAYLASLQTRIDVRAALATLDAAEPELVTATQRRMLWQRTTPSSLSAPPIYGGNPLEAYAGQAGGASEKAMAVHLAGGRVDLSVQPVIVTVVAIDGMAAAQAEEAAGLIGLGIAFSDVGEHVEFGGEVARMPSSMANGALREITGRVDLVRIYNCSSSEGHDGHPKTPVWHDGTSWNTCYDALLLVPASHTVDVTVAGTLSVPRSASGAPGPRRAAGTVPFTASLKFHEVEGEECDVGGNKTGDYFQGVFVWGITRLDFALTLPGDSVLTADEASLLTSYTFAAPCTSSPDMQGYVQVSTKSPVLLALMEHLTEITAAPEYGQETWIEESRRAGLT